jgi:NAD(P)-dependent dehydrogenase (short-subunit alcohol dehydrogenase family)
MAIDLSSRVAVVTGASRGIGLHIARKLALEGAHVGLVARNADALRQVEAELRAQGAVCVALPADCSRPEEVERLKYDVEQSLGPPSILVNAAGMFGPIQTVRDGDATEWIATLMVNTIAPYLTCRAFVGSMIDTGWGRIVNVSSAAALGEPGPFNSAYATSKVALNHFTRQLAAEVAGTGVTATVIHPGEVKTEMWADIRDRALRSGAQGEGMLQWVEWVEQTGGDPPEKAAELVFQLMSEESGSINGQFLWIADGLKAPMPSWS